MAFGRKYCEEEDEGRGRVGQEGTVTDCIYQDRSLGK